MSEKDLVTEEEIRQVLIEIAEDADMDTWDNGCRL